ncbi:MAG: cytochrome c biogenesis protein CcdC [Thermoactinomyces sp.]
MTPFFQTVLPIAAFMMAIIVIFLRLRAAKKPTNAKKILIPPLGMSTGFAMFFFPPTHIPWSWAIAAFLTGALFLSIPLIQTSKMEVIGEQVYLKRSRTFVIILIVLFAIRMSLHTYIEHILSIYQTGSLFFILAFGMLLPWRLSMYIQYKKQLLKLKGLQKSKAQTT